MPPVFKSSLLNSCRERWEDWRVKPVVRSQAPVCLLGVMAPLMLGCSPVPPSEPTSSFTDEEFTSSDTTKVDQPSSDFASPPLDRTKNPPQIAVASQENLAAVRQDDERLLTESWEAYKQRFIQADGRVIDYESSDRTVSEGQAYAMLRAVLIDDPETFDLTLQWAESNLRRSPLPNDSDGEDHLWAWLWGQDSNGNWTILDPNFASDADIDAITALILAAQQWDRPEYLELAQKKLEDLWNQSTLMPLTLEDSSTRRYLLPGPRIAFQPQPGKIYINPSYLAPYAFRLFAEVDPNPDRDWMLLVDSSYDILEQTKNLSQNGLPGDWIMLDLSSQEIEPVSPNSSLKTQYGFDAYRVWWRITWDAFLFDEARAKEFLDDHLTYFQELWEDEGRIPAVINLSGQALVDYEATSQYAMLYPAFQQFAPETAESIRNDKLFATYSEGIWDNPDAYYVQNLAWLGILPEEKLRSIFATSDFGRR